MAPIEDLLPQTEHHRITDAFGQIAGARLDGDSFVGIQFFPVVLDALVDYGYQKDADCRKNERFQRFNVPPREYYALTVAGMELLAFDVAKSVNSIPQLHYIN